jgi:hypothetical protein
MYAKLPNLVVAFHGCDKSTFDDVILKQKPLKPSNNSYDWLGNGIYFWESNLQRAQEWAEEQAVRKKYTSPTVIGAVIDLGYCLNLADSAFFPVLEFGYNWLNSISRDENKPLPINRIGVDNVLRELDCAVIEQVHDLNIINDEKSFDSVRGLFIEGDEVYEGSGFRHKTHIQICIRNPNCIKGYFNPLIEDIRYPLP